MELDACIAGRRSIRSYKDQAVPKDIVNKILSAGSWAPSGMNTQPWRFTIIENRETINSLSRRTKELVKQRMPLPENLQEAFKSDRDVVFYGAPLLIFISVQKKEEWRTVNLLDCGLAAQNMFLAAYQAGLGSCFIGFASFLNQDPKVLAEIGIPEDHELVAPLIFGYPNETPVSKSREVKVLKWI
ncbi:MAG: nitroreductase family protein [Bacteroidales bacterium]|nr:nitroreductase family protein [Bacteroidales bacterium]